MKRTSVLLFTALVVAASIGVAQAQPGRGGSNSTFQFRIGGFFPTGDGDVWTDIEETFFLSAGDFDDPVLGFSYVTGVSNHLEIGVNIDFYDSTVATDYREYVDEDGFPIIHDTRLEMMPVSVDLRLLPAGRHSYRGKGGRFQLRKPVFYFGGGIGMNFYEYEEFGDFIDFSLDPPEVFYDEFQDSGVSFQTHALAGLEIPVGSSWALLLESRYTWSEEELKEDFSGFGDLDLGGYAFYVGGSFSF